jgi:hypothetical protein
MHTPSLVSRVKTSYILLIGAEENNLLASCLKLNTTIAVKKTHKQCGQVKNPKTELGKFNSPHGGNAGDG